jgi:hypothetical protein
VTLLKKLLKKENLMSIAFLGFVPDNDKPEAEAIVAPYVVKLKELNAKGVFQIYFKLARHKVGEYSYAFVKAQADPALPVAEIPLGLGAIGDKFGLLESGNAYEIHNINPRLAALHGI